MSLVSQRLRTRRADKGCWTCKARKIGCDKTLPACNNCVRTKRSCGGYGIKLHWPDSADGRRPINFWDTSPNQRRPETRSQRGYGQIYFLHTTDVDLESRMINVWIRREERSMSPASPSIGRSLAFGYETSSNTSNRQLLSYYNEVLSRMITTIDDGRNGFRTVLLPNALSLQSLASQSLHEAILALSALHLRGRQAATKHKIYSIRLLSKSIQDNESQYVGQFGTCMMLCVCDVFDAVDGSWYSHMRAADTISHLVAAQRTPEDPSMCFLTSWLAYHKILSEFSRMPDETDHIGWDPTLPGADPRSHIIIGSLGCSMQVLECISCINRLANIVDKSPSQRLPHQFSLMPAQLEAQLESQQQTPQIVYEVVNGCLDESRITNTAELYRIAAQIYLHQSVTRKPVNCPQLKLLVNEALQILRTLDICTSPWPLFIIAREVTGDEQRVMILETLDKMQKERRIGNVEIMRNIIEAVWKRADLNAETKAKKRVNWRDLVDTKHQIPSFI
ncbi:fungal-specific transcription factor domain-containing protein [Cadophora sp. MPI-SDFR-AT-0126]|nr:fungal-specific transcription factor domain-containing protein [Leotiomycetes sp. MPI-SDFR-AT-0126]